MKPVFSALTVLCVLFFPYSAHAQNDADKYLRAVQQFGDLVLGGGWGFEEQPSLKLFADGFNYYTGEPVKILSNGVEHIPSNLANQQLLMRTLAALTDLTGDPKYKEAAKQRIKYYFDKYTDVNGLLRWGGHRFVDLRLGTIKGEQNMHELKAVYPYYDLMYETDPEATLRFIRAYWNSGVTDWNGIAVNRHGPYTKSMGDLWSNPYGGNTDPKISVGGLPFASSGYDMMYAAAKYMEYTGDDSPAVWIDRLQTLYANARHPETKLGGHQYGILQTGDRAAQQLGADFGDRALEMNFMPASAIREYYGVETRGIIQLAKQLGDENLKQYITEGMEAFFKYAYDNENYRVYSMFTDGERIHDYTLTTSGYYGNAGQKPTQSGPGGMLNYAAVVVACNSDSDVVWQGARDINIRYNYLGDIGDRAGNGIKLKTNITASAPVAALTALELYEYSGNPVFLEAAKKVADNILSLRFENGQFVEKSSRYFNMKLGNLDTIALLKVAAAMKGVTVDALDFYLQGGFIHGTFDGFGRNFDNDVLYTLMREEYPSSYSSIVTLDNFNGYLTDTKLNGHGGFTQRAGNSAVIVRRPGAADPNDNALKMPGNSTVELDLRKPVPLNCPGRLAVEFEMEGKGADWNVSLIGDGKIAEFSGQNNGEDFSGVSLSIDKTALTAEGDYLNGEAFNREAWVTGISITVSSDDTYIDNLKIYEKDTFAQPEYLCDIDFEEGIYTEGSLFSSTYGTQYGQCVLIPGNESFIHGGAQPLVITEDAEQNNCLEFGAEQTQEAILQLPQPVSLAESGDDLVLEYDYSYDSSNSRLDISFMNQNAEIIFKAAYNAVDCVFASGAGTARNIGYNYIQYKNVNNGWQHAKIVFNRAEQSADLYIDGILRVMDVKNVTGFPSEISQIKFSKNSYKNLSNAYIDNIRLYTQSPSGATDAVRVTKPRVYQDGEYNDIYQFKRYHQNTYNACFTIKFPNASLSAPQSVTVLQAHYDKEGTLVGVSSSPHEITSGDVCYIENLYSTSQDPDAGDCLKTMIWDSGAFTPFITSTDIYRP